VCFLAAMAARKPLSASDVLRATSPRKSISGTFLSVNKFAHLRPQSPGPASPAVPAPAPDGRIRLGSASQKRKNSDGSNANVNSYANIAANSGTGSGTFLSSGSATSNTSYAPNEELVMKITKVKSITEAVDKDIGDANADVTVLAILKNINDAISGLCDAVLTPGCTGPQQLPIPAPAQSSQTLHSSQTTTGMVCLGTISKKQRTGTPAPLVPQIPGFVQQAKKVNKNAAQPPPHNPEPAASPAEQSFRDTIKHAEKSTLVFNLNMGNVPILNTDTMSKRATLALTSMAAVAEGNRADSPSKDAVAMIDDIMSVSTGIHFYGTATKSYKHPNDKDSNLFCTVPVRYDFNDKDTKVQVEQLLRTKCGAKCSTPYPPILRECIRRVIDDTKREFPENLIKVSVDTTNFSLKVARRPSNSDNKAWVYAVEDIPLPREALDTRSRKIPDNMLIPKAKFLAPRPLTPLSQSPPSPMAVTDPDLTNSNDG
jgi:hypothetical protein